MEIMEILQNTINAEVEKKVAEKVAQIEVANAGIKAITFDDVKKFIKETIIEGADFRELVNLLAYNNEELLAQAVYDCVESSVMEDNLDEGIKDRVVEDWWHNATSSDVINKIGDYWDFRDCAKDCINEI